jgi:hypothetical protein
MGEPSATHRELLVEKHSWYSPPAVLWKATLPDTSATRLSTVPPLGSSTRMITAESV